MIRAAANQLHLRNQLDQFLWSRCHRAVCSQSLKEPMVSVAAGLRHSLAVAGKFAPKMSSVCFHLANHKSWWSVLPSDSGCVYQWGRGLFSHAKRVLSPRPVPSHLSSTVPSLVPGMWNSVHLRKTKFIGFMWFTMPLMIDKCDQMLLSMLQVWIRRPLTWWLLA